MLYAIRIRTNFEIEEEVQVILRQAIFDAVRTSKMLTSIVRNYPLTFETFDEAQNEKRFILQFITNGGKDSKPNEEFYVRYVEAVISHTDAISVEVEEAGKSQKPHEYVVQVDLDFELKLIGLSTPN